MPKHPDEPPARPGPSRPSPSRGAQRPYPPQFLSKSYCPTVRALRALASMSFQKKIGEERAAAMVVDVAKRVQRNHPDSEPMGILIAAAATLFLAGFSDPKDRHVIHAARRMRERLVADSAAPVTRETTRRTVDEAEAEVIRSAWPDWFHVKAHLYAYLPTATFLLWIEPIVCCGWSEDGRMQLGAPDNVRAWCERR